MGHGMSKVLDGFYVGNIQDSRNESCLSEHSITHIISIHDDAKPHFSHIQYLCIELDDLPSAQLSLHFEQCILFIHRARTSRGNVLVHCMAGVSRSVTVAMAYLLAVTDLTWRQALGAIRGARRIANPNFGFQKQVQDWCVEQRQRCKAGLAQLPPCPHDDRVRCLQLLEVHERWVRTGELEDNTYPLAAGAYEASAAPRHKEELSPMQKAQASMRNALHATIRNNSRILLEDDSSSERRGVSAASPLDHRTVSTNHLQLPSNHEAHQQGCGHSEVREEPAALSIQSTLLNCDVHTASSGSCATSTQSNDTTACNCIASARSDCTAVNNQTSRDHVCTTSVVYGNHAVTVDRVSPDADRAPRKNYVCVASSTDLAPVTAVTHS